MSSFSWNNIFLNNYGTPAIELVAGEGVIVKDSQGSIYLDFLSGIAVAVVEPFEMVTLTPASAGKTTPSTLPKFLSQNGFNLGLR
jgi:hypothetical protein